MSSPKLEALVGQSLDAHYRIDKLLGAGGMGAVYKARHTKLERDVAIKILHPDIGGDPSISKRFDREAQSASRLDHPNCVRVSDFGTTAEGIKYLVMELLEGEELAARLEQPWTPAAVLDLLEQIFAALEHAHACGIVHRDLKPENVFLTRDAQGQEVAKLVDFGIAKLLDADGAAEVLTRAGMVFGTPRYMSPEQAAGGKIDERSDLYSVGVIAHQLLSGKPPFDSEDLAAILRMQIIAPPPPLPDSVPQPIAGFVEALLEKSRHERPTSAAAALATIRDLRAQLQQTQSQQTQASVDPTRSTQPGVDLLGATGMHTAASLPDVSPDAPLPSKPEAMPGHRVAGRFVLERLLGIGGMGAVFRARDEQTGSVVAVKLLHAAMAGDEELAARFVREAETAAELEHPNIVPVFGHGTTPGTGGPAPYLVMPLLEGVELRDLIGAPLEPSRAVALMTQLLAALEHAHAHGIVHRDLKPENVFVIRDPSGAEVIQLVDFGLAKVAEGGSSRRALTQFGQVFGTPAYMSPEQCRGEVVDARTDLYAAGVILYELLAGRAPFDADDPVTLLTLQLTASPPPLPEQVSPGLREVVDGLLIKDRNARIPDAGTAARMLVQALTAPAPPQPTPSVGATIPSLAGAPVTATPAPVARLPRLGLYVGAAVVGVLVIIAAWPSDSSVAEGSDDAASLAIGGSSPSVGGARPKPDPGVYLDIDRELSGKNREQAMALIRSARDRFPEDGGLLWREARALVMAGTEAERVTALHRYAEALAAEPSLGDTTEFVAELRNLLREPSLRATAIDVAVRDLGEAGHSFLLEVLNDEKAKLSYVDRHRILDQLASNPTLLARVDLRRQRALDLEQAASSPSPCSAFARALEHIAEADDPYFLEVLMNRSLSIPSTPGVGESAEDCAGLDAKREQVKGTLAANHPEQAAKLERSNSKKSGKKKGFRFPF
ncbi:MAG: serine/threonine-protein kinase [Enhygromyxa sp.]